MVLILNIHLETRITRSCACAPTICRKVTSPQDGGNPTEENGYAGAQPEKAKPERQQAAVQGITPAQPAPVSARDQEPAPPRQLVARRRRPGAEPGGGCPAQPA